MRTLWTGGVAATLLWAASAATAAPVAVGLNAFGASTLITFDTLADRALLGEQYAALGVHIGGDPGYTDNSAGVRAVFGSQGAGNVLDGVSTGSIITLLFDNPIVRLGFDQFSNGRAMYVEGDNGFLAYGTGAAASFVGYQDLSGFTSVSLYIQSELDPLFRIDNLRFERAAVVSEPAGLALAGLALAAAAVARRRRPASSEA